MVACAFHSSTGKCSQEDYCEFKTSLCCIVSFIQSELQSEIFSFHHGEKKKKNRQKTQKTVDEK